MLNQQDFMETLRAVETMAKASDKPLTREEIMEEFQDLELSQEQADLVYDYFLKKVSAEESDMPETDDAVEELKTSAKTHSQAEQKFLESAFVRMYRDDIAGIEPLAQDVLEQEVVRLFAGDSTAATTVVNQYLSRVIEIAKRYASLPVRMEDVVQEGNMALLLTVEQCKTGDALDAYGDAVDVRRAVDVLDEEIRIAMERYIDQILEDENWQNAVLGRANLLNAATEALAKDLMRVPTNREISEYTKLSEQEIEDIMALVKKR
jgi:RNA polymerase primary sigma factor